MSVYDWQTRARAEDLRRAGWSCTQVSKALHVDRTSVALWTKHLNLPPGTRIQLVRQAQMVVDLYLAGETTTSIAREVPCTQKHAQDLIRAARRHWPEIPARTTGGRWLGPLPERRIRVGPKDVIAMRSLRL